MDQQEWLARQFEEHRPHLRAVAYRMLGRLSGADDGVQDACLRVSRADARLRGGPAPPPICLLGLHHFDQSEARRRGRSVAGGDDTA